MDRHGLLAFVAVGFSGAVFIGGSASTLAAPSGEFQLLTQSGFFHPNRVCSPPRQPRHDVAPGPMLYHCGPVMTMPGVALIFWGTGGDPTGEVPYLSAFVNGIGGSTWVNTVTQYYQSPPQIFISNSANQLVGYFVDHSRVPRVPTIAQVAAEAVKIARLYGYSANVNYFVALPPNHGPSFFRRHQACALHNWVTFGSGPQLSFTVFPYMADVGARCGQYLVNHPTPSNPKNGINDGVSIFASHEIAEAYTDPFGTGWYDTSGGSGEIGDKCDLNIVMPQNIQFSSGVFPVEPLWSNASNACVFAGP